MPPRYLSQKSSGWQFQIRVPTFLIRDSSLAPIRVTLGALGALEARRRAAILAGAAQVAFMRVKQMSGACELSDKERRDRAFEFMAELVGPALAGMDALADAETPPDPDVVDAAFDALALIGANRASGSGPFSGRGIRHEVPYLAALRSPAIARAYAGQGDLEGLVDQSRMLETLQVLAAKVPTDPEVKKGDLFSVVANKRIAEIKGTKGEDAELAGIYQKVRDEFLAICGDRAVGEYRRDDLQRYVNEISWLPQNAHRKGPLSRGRLLRSIAANRKAGGMGLAQKSIREGRLVYVKALIKAGCEEADIRNRAAAGRAIVIPDRAAPPVQRYAPDPKAFERVLRAGVESGVLSDALLPALGLLTGRRIGLLAYLYRQDLHFEHGVWAFRIRSHAMRGGSWERVPVKTDASLGLIVLPRILESCGFVDWAKSGTGPVFPRLMACQDPADAAQKRANRLIKDQFDEADPQWVFHCLRHGRIDNDRDAEVSEYITRKAVGHADQSIHGLDGQLTPKQKRMIADAPLPEGIDWLLLNRIDWEKFANAVPRVRRRKSLL